MKIKYALAVAVVVLAILTAVACNSSATTAPETPTDVTENALPSVVQIITSSGSGTGFIVSENGLVVTNKHVVEGERRVTVRLRTGEEYRGDVSQTSSVFDLAYVEIDSTRSFTPLLLGDSGAVRVSEPAIAIGYPLSEELGLEPTVSLGIISAKRDDYLQADASLNPGNSGGPLLDANGKVIGVITARVESTETGRPVTGIGFAIPISAARQDLQSVTAAGSASPNSTSTPLPTIPPTPDVEATKAAIEDMDAHRRQAEQATRAATEAQQEAERYSASLEATRIAELSTPTPTHTPAPTPTPTVTPTPTPTSLPTPTSTPEPTSTPLPPTPTPTPHQATFCMEWEAMVLEWVKQDNSCRHSWERSMVRPDVPDHPRLSANMAQSYGCLTTFPVGVIGMGPGYPNNKLFVIFNIEVGSGGGQLLPGACEYRQTGGTKRVTVPCTLSLNLGSNSQTTIQPPIGESFTFRFFEYHERVEFNCASTGSGTDHSALYRIGD